jgi:hypothetical protein
MMIPIVRGIQKLPGCWESGGGQSTCIRILSEVISW